ncbi:hypothetical protein FLGE108171_05435 [Flavobacterium gelidilacus]|jgi:threonine/homoserine/homoserine lactone efflux protein|uniref:hypothetical protein n=1 Tax=Flavobacterium gelidilacus TaxID=206041 RepID=UPI00041EA2A0|nr:hypothetical protein [Flavobacterium gelidilacus]
MKISKIIGIVLILGSLYLGYLGINKVANNSAELNVLGLKIDASNDSGKEQGFIYIGLAIVLLGSGVYSINKE